MSRLEDYSKQFRECTIVRNSYQNTDQYVLGHPNALSDGDELGKGENNNSIGGLTDIRTRETSISRNKYNKNKEYRAGAC